MMYICAICGSEFEHLEGYINCVAACGKKVQEEKKIQELNADINKVKAAKQYYEETVDWFKQKYPKEYELNFGAKQCDCDAKICSCETSKTKIYNEHPKHDENLDAMSTIAVSVLNNEDGKVKVEAAVNGKKVDNDTLRKLLDNPDTKYIAKVLKMMNLL